ncbi:Homeodomain-like protein [Phlebopus sp. FC_14]|nr:Homeodomain-like protein [Phlebopus sp. FC_14]
MPQSQVSPSIRELTQKAVQANKEHQRALKAYTEKLEAELDTVDKLMDSVDVTDLEDEADLDVGGFVVIPGSVRAAAPISPKGLSSLDSPFYNDALRRNRYLTATDVHTMRPRELETLREAVRTENYRRGALDSQRRGLPAFSDLREQPSNYLELNTEGLDWDRIAEKVSTVSMTTRTARACEIRWLGDLHPDFSHEPWTQEEISSLKALLLQGKGKGMQPDWVDIAKKLDTNRTPLDCMRHGTTRKLHVWTTESDERLLKAVRMYGHNNWSLVARYVSEDATASQCNNRYQHTLDPDIRRAKWTVEEDARLRMAVAAYGPSWVNVAAVLPGRHNDQCRERWNEQVHPAINKTPWTVEEDNKLVDLVRATDTLDWKEISEHLNTGRTENMSLRNVPEGSETRSSNVFSKLPACSHTSLRLLFTDKRNFTRWDTELGSSSRTF